MKKNKIFQWLKFLFPLPFFIGMVGYLQLYPGDISDGMYYTLRLYTFEYDMEDINFLLDIARWTAPAVVTAFVLTGLQSVFEFLSNGWKKIFRRKNLLAVYGDNEKTQAFIASLPKEVEVIKGNFLQEFHKVKRQVIMFESLEENLAFYQKHFNDFSSDDQVFLRLEGLSPNLMQDSRFEFHPFSLAKTTAFSFLSQEAAQLSKKSFQQEEVHIVLIGAGNYARELLDMWLNFNVFHVKQRFTYHIFGDFSQYASQHFALPQEETERYLELTLYPEDKIRFYKNSWSTEISSLSQMDLVVLCQENDLKNLLLVDQILSYVPMEKLKHGLHLQLQNDKTYHSFTTEKQLFSVFGSNTKVCDSALILQDSVLESAKEQMAEYVQLTQQVMSQYANWKELDPHIRDSNLYSAMYRESVFCSIPAYLEGMSATEQLEFMAELEHIRWNRFHFLRNWTLTPESLEKLDRLSRRLHTDLIHYVDLTDEIQSYDRKEAEKVLAEYKEKTR